MTAAVSIAQMGNISPTFKNRIINGAMQIDQRNAGASVSASGYTIDRFYTILQSGSGHTIQQVSDAPSGFVKSSKITIGTGATPTSGQQNLFYQPIEGFNISDFNFGTANAVTTTISFWVKASVTGTYNVCYAAIQTPARSYISTYTISSANTWEYKTITITGDLSGTYPTNNTGSLYLIFNLGSGSSYIGSVNSWLSTDSKVSSGATQIIATSGATFYITGVQLEKGSTATSFDYRPYGTELALCQRYYQKFIGSQYLNECVGVAVGGGTMYFNKPFITTMRSAPTFSSSGTFHADGTTYNAVTLSMPYASTVTARLDGTGSGWTAGQGYALTHQSTDSYLQFSAEL